MINTEIKVLIVDDNEQYLTVLHEVFISDGCFDVIGAVTDGLKAIQVIKNIMPDVILTDIMMPNLDGIGLLEYLKNIPKEQRPVVIVHTCVNSNCIYNMAIELGAEYCILKPYPLKDLIQRIKKIYRFTSSMQNRNQDSFTERRLDKIVEYVLDNYKIPKKLDGYNYFSEAISYYVENYFNNDLQLKQVNMAISKKMGTNCANIERSMRNALRSEKANLGFENSPSKFPKFDDNVTCLTFITTVSDYVKNIWETG